MTDSGRGYRMLSEQEAGIALGIVYRQLKRELRDHPFSRIMTLHDVEFSLCEWDKYERALWKQGFPKSTFTPTNYLRHD